jgi:hypothetical protein
MNDYKYISFEFAAALGTRYNTAGTIRDFQTSIGKNIKIIGGLYGWIIDLGAETNEIIKNINIGGVIEKEPVYSQRALLRMLLMFAF